MAAAAGFLFTPGCRSRSSTCWCRSPPRALVLAAALAAYVMVKFFGVIFLGQPREANLAYAHDAGRWSASAWSGSRSAASLLGLLPVTVIAAARPRQRDAGRLDRSASAATASWLLLAPIDADRASYSPLIVPAGDRRRRRCSRCRSCVALPRARARGAARGTAASRCRRRACRTRPKASASRSGRSSSRSSASSASCRRPSTRSRATRVSVEDHFWHWLYLPIAARRRVRWRGWSARIQQGRISIYLLYSFVTLLALLFFVAMSVAGILLASCSQLALALLLAPLLVGWVNQCRAWLQNRSAPPLLQPYRDAAQAVPQGRGRRRERLAAVPRSTPYIVFGCMVLRRGDRPVAGDRPAVRAAPPTRSRWSACSRWRACSSRSPRWTSAPPSARWARGARC